MTEHSAEDARLTEQQFALLAHSVAAGREAASGFLAGFTEDRVAQAKAEALGELADAIDSNDFQQAESSDDTWLDGCCDVLDLIESMESRIRSDKADS